MTPDTSPRTADRLSVVFIGQQNFYTNFLIDWMSQLADVRGVIWTASDRHGFGARWRRFRLRVKRGGFSRASSELMFFLLAKLRYQQDQPLLRALIDQARRDWNVQPVMVPAIHVPNLRDSQVKPFLERLRPNILFTQCINEIIPKQVYGFPSQGCYVFHEGMVPKYRGKFCTHWAILNGDFDQVGASVIKVDEGLDLGAVAFTEHVMPQTIGRGHGWLEHEVLFLALPRLKSWLEEMTHGNAAVTPQTERYPLYSYPLVSHFWQVERQKEAFDKWRREQSNASAVATN